MLTNGTLLQSVTTLVLFICIIIIIIIMCE